MPSRDEPSEGKVYVGDLGSSGSKQELEDAFSYYGPLKNVWVARNPPGFAFVEFEDARDAEDSVRDMDGKTVCGRRIKVEMASGRGKGGSYKDGRGSTSSRYDSSPECKVYVGDLGSYGSKQELEDAFSYYGPLRNVWVAQNPPGFAFVEFEDPRDAEDSVRGLDGRRVCGRRIKVEMATGRRKSGGGGGGRSRGSYGGGYGGGGRAPPRGGRGSDERCYECGERGHFARDCRGGRGSGSYRGGTSGSRRRSYSRSRSRSPRSRSPRSRSRSYSRSRSQD